MASSGRRALALLALVLQLAVLLVWSRSKAALDDPAAPPHLAMAAALELPEHSIWKLHAESIDGEDVALSRFAGRVALVVNVASK
jgi:hypothetical protein